MSDLHKTPGIPGSTATLAERVRVRIARSLPGDPGVDHIWPLRPAGTARRRKLSGGYAPLEGRGEGTAGIPVIHLVRPDAWWIATFWAPGETPWSLTFDLCRPPVLDVVVIPPTGRHAPHAHDLNTKG